MCVCVSVCVCFCVCVLACVCWMVVLCLRGVVYAAGSECCVFICADALSRYVDRCRQLGFDCEAARILKGCCYPLLNDKTQVCCPSSRQNPQSRPPQSQLFRCQPAYTCCAAAARSRWRALLSLAPTAARRVSRALCVACQ